MHGEFQQWDAKRVQDEKEIQEEYSQMVHNKKCPERYQAQAFQAYENGVPENQIWSFIHAGHLNDAQQARDRHEKKRAKFVEKTMDLIKNFSKKRSFAVDETPSRCGRRSHHRQNDLCHDSSTGVTPARWMEIGETFQICGDEQECWVEMYKPESEEEDKIDYCLNGIPGRYQK